MIIWRENGWGGEVLRFWQRLVLGRWLCRFLHSVISRGEVRLISIPFFLYLYSTSIKERMLTKETIHFAEVLKSLNQHTGIVPVLVLKDSNNLSYECIHPDVAHEAGRWAQYKL